MAITTCELHNVRHEWREPCPRCLQESKERKRLASQSENEASAYAAKVAGFKPLEKGTPKQIAWAETIRIKSSTNMQMRCAIETIDEPFMLDAKWWIDNRNKYAPQLAESLGITIKIAREHERKSDRTATYGPAS